jgi:hypothetical protein
MQYLVLCHPGDITAARVYTLMCKRAGRNNVRLVTAEELTFAPSIEHRVGDSVESETGVGEGSGSGAYSILKLHDGTVIDSRTVCGVLNRLMYAPSPCFHDQASVNSQYSGMEMHALVMSIIESLAGSPNQSVRAKIIGRVSGTGLRGREAPLPVWLGMAVRSGLRVRGYDFVSSPRVGSRLGWIPREPVLQGQVSQQESSSDGYVDIPLDQAIMMGKPTTYFEPCAEGDTPTPHASHEHSQPVTGFSALAICGHILGGMLNDQQRAACTRLVTTMQCDLVELRFCLTQTHIGQPQLAFCGVNLLPDVTDPAHLKFLVDQLLATSDGQNSACAFTPAGPTSALNQSGDTDPVSVHRNAQGDSSTQLTQASPSKHATPLEVP